MTTVLLCLCGDTKPDHVMGKRACNRCGTCDSFELDGEVPTSQLAQDLDELEAADPAVAEASARLDETTAAIVSKARFATGGLITDPAHAQQELEAARGDDVADFASELRRVEQERDELRDELNSAKTAWTLAAGSRQFNRNRALKAEAELASARTELEQLRMELAETFRAAGHAVVAEQVGVIAQHVRYLCETCGARYGIAYDDHEHGPLTPVTVTIARQGAPAA